MTRCPKREWGLARSRFSRTVEDGFDEVVVLRDTSHVFQLEVAKGSAKLQLTLVCWAHTREVQGRALAPHCDTGDV